MAPPPGYVVTPSGQQPIRSANDTAEYRRNYTAAEYVNALYALDHGYTGQGVTVGVIDDGVNTALPDFAGRIDLAMSKDFGKVTKDGVATLRNVLGDSNSDHGTAVAGIIAANRDGANSQGLAPDAKIAVLRVSDNNFDTGSENVPHILEAFDFATANKIKVLSVSLVSGGASMLGDAWTKFASTGGLVVNGAGNDAGANPVDGPAITDANKNAVIFVVALNGSVNSYGIASYSNMAGNQMDRTVAAPGSNITTNVNGGTQSFSGTSSATPVVSALAATILSKWPQLTGQQAGNVILSTAKDIGTPGVDPIYGHGLVDFQAALLPINPTLSNGTTTASVQTSYMAAAGAIGVGSIQTALSNVTVLDEYGRDFTGSVAGMVIKPEAKDGHWLRRRLLTMNTTNGGQIAIGGFSGSFGFANYQYGFNANDVRSTITAGQIGYISGSTGFRGSWNANDSLQSDIMGLAPFADGIMAYAPQAANSFGVDRYVGSGKIGLTISTGRQYGTAAKAATLGWTGRNTTLRVSLIDEAGSVMGMPTGAGALRLGRGASTVMIEAHESHSFANGWTMEGYGSVGMTRLKVDQASLITGASTLLASRIGIQASKPMLGGMASFGIAQPLVVESGAAHLTTGNGYDLTTRSLTYVTTNESLGGQRRLQLTAGYGRGGARSSFRIGFMQDLTENTTRALAAWSKAF